MKIKYTAEQAKKQLVFNAIRRRKIYVEDLEVWFNRQIEDAYTNQVLYSPAVAMGPYGDEESLKIFIGMLTLLGYEVNKINSDPETYSITWK